MSAKQLVTEYAVLQGRLCEELFNQHPVDDANYLTDLPKHGSLPLGNDLWEFKQHGSGVCFSHISSHEIVDAHIKPVSYPEGIDAWRLVLYLESKGVKALNHGRTEFDATNQRAVEQMLEVFCSEGLIQVTDRKHRIYTLAIA